MIKKQVLRFFIAASVISSGLQAMVSDSRYFPWYQRFYERTSERRSIADFEIFFMTGGHARGTESVEQVGIPEIWGAYDLQQLSNALIILGEETPLLGEWQLQKAIAMELKGKLEGQGASLVFEWCIGDGFSLCFSTGFMHACSTQRFLIPKVTRMDMGLTPSQQLQLDAERRQINQMLGFTQEQWSKTGMIDTEVYLRYGLVRDYGWKFRKIDIALYLGALIPSGVKRDPANPASVPFGGNGHPGIFFGGEGLFEIKEDWNVGLRLQVNKRFAKTQEQRISINYEMEPFGAVQGPVRVDPGATGIFSLYFGMGDLREGWGASAQYMLSYHGGDVWTDKRLDKTIPSTMNSPYINGNKQMPNPNYLYKVTQWAAEYIAVSIFYNPDRFSSDERHHPLLSFQWDIPIHLLAEERVSKTNSISVGLIVNF